MEKRGMKTDDAGGAHFAVARADRPAASVATLRSTFGRPARAKPLLQRAKTIYNINQPHGGPLN